MTEEVSQEEFERRIAKAEKALREAFGGKPNTFEATLRRAGRRLPRKARRAGEEVVAAQALAGHPQLRLQIDWDRVTKNLDRVIEAARRIDRKDDRKGRILGALASLAFNLLLLFTLIIVFAVWQGWL
ncbi:hypothetical protein [Pseudooceanicola sp. MF1-13]|uniref:hypothetical protein n=1 Tax=Pseudooceanicola sp. MF1-13 TaxID=3379095 RepID=UPI0038919B33